MTTLSHAAARAGMLVAAAVFVPVQADELFRPEPPTAEQAAFFESQVRPLLIQHCHECHGEDVQEGGLRLDSLAAMLNGGESGPALVPKDPEASLLLKAIGYEDAALQMPPEERLSKPQEAILRQWVEMGSPWPGVNEVTIRARSTAREITEEDRSFWSFRPLRRVAPPSCDDSWPRTPIDRFILAKLRQLQLRPRDLADRRTLIRRAYFDLIGLPPTPEDVDAFVESADPQAYENLIDHLLDSPRYGERWARHWLDIARFAESHGYEQDYDRPYAFHYRDFLIKALNSDMPYDQFVRWQIAGDELAPEEPLAMMATGFLGAGAFPTQLTEAEFETARYDELDDMASTVGSAFLGLTVGCARCHDHKYDPIPTVDYYQFVSSFTATIRSEVELRPDASDASTEAVKVQVTSEGFPHTKHHADDRGYPHFYPQTFLLARGDVKQKRGPVEPSFLHVLMPAGEDASHWRVEPPSGWSRTSFHRASLANWLTDADEGAGDLLARVIVNRLWQHHFGRGIVATPNDFGFQGERPTHPELLDWLASELIDHGWHLKRIHKLIMTSSVYMQDGRESHPELDDASIVSAGADAARPDEVDPANRWYWRHTSRRLEGEAIRDAMLHVGGILDPTMYGAGTLDETMRRRSIYFFIKRSKLIPAMMLFDWPEHLVSVGQRSSTTIAPQALMLINNPQVRASANGLARRLGQLPLTEAVTQAYRLALGRGPRNDELEIATAFITSQSRSYPPDEAAFLALTDFCQSLLCSNEFVYLD